MASIYKAIVEGLEHIQITHYAQLSSSTIIVYDHIVTFGDEVELIWKSRWTLGKVLFLMNRYYSLAAVIVNNYGFFSPKITNSFCYTFFHWQGWTGLIGCMLAQGILQLRLYALFARNKKILALMLTFFALSSATSGWIMGSVLQGITATAVKLPIGGKFCVPNGVPSHFYTFWIPLLAYECLLCALALIRGFQAVKTSGTMFDGRVLVGILVRDSVLYFLVICVTYLTCLLTWIMLPASLLEVSIGFSIALSCVLSNRVVMNVRDVGREMQSTVFSSQKPSRAAYDTSFCSPGTLTQFEMGQLRSMRADRRLAEIVEAYEYSSYADTESRYSPPTTPTSSTPWIVM